MSTPTPTPTLTPNADASDSSNASASARGRSSPSLSHCLMAGLIAGVAAAFCANAVDLLFEQGLGGQFEELTPVSIMMASVISCLIGSAVYWALGRFTRRPVLWFVVLGLAAATLDSILPIIGDFPQGFALQANVLHYVVAAVAFIAIPPISEVRGGVMKV